MQNELKKFDELNNLEKIELLKTQGYIYLADKDDVYYCIDRFIPGVHLVLLKGGSTTHISSVSFEDSEVDYSVSKRHIFFTIKDDNYKAIVDFVFDLQKHVAIKEIHLNLEPKGIIDFKDLDHMFIKMNYSEESGIKRKIINYDETVIDFFSKLKSYLSKFDTFGFITTTPSNEDLEYKIQEYLIKEVGLKPHQGLITDNQNL